MYNFGNNKSERDILDNLFIGFYNLINNIFISINGK